MFKEGEEKKTDKRNENQSRERMCDNSEGQQIRWWWGEEMRGRVRVYEQI